MPSTGRNKVRAVNITNETEDPSYIVEELAGYVLLLGQTVNLIDTNLDFYYVSFEDAVRAVTECETSKLYQDIQAGKISVVIS